MTHEAEVEEIVSTVGDCLKDRPRWGVSYADLVYIVNNHADFDVILKIAAAMAHLRWPVLGMSRLEQERQDVIIFENWYAIPVNESIRRLQNFIDWLGDRHGVL